MKTTLKTNVVLGVSDVVDNLSSLLNAHLIIGKKVFWLISGGSSIPIAVQVSKTISPAFYPQLWTMLVDEIINIQESETNGERLLRAGFATGIPFIKIYEKGLALEEMVLHFGAAIAEKIGWADVSVGQFGIGDGFHTGGIMPRSIAAETHNKLAIAYEHEEAKKITVTPGLVEKLDIVFINSLGETKRELVRHFLNSKENIYDEPTQALKLAKHCYLASDVLPRGKN